MSCIALCNIFYFTLADLLSYCSHSSILLFYCLTYFFFSASLLLQECLFFCIIVSNNTCFFICSLVSCASFLLCFGLSPFYKNKMMLTYAQWVYNCINFLTIGLRLCFIPDWWYKNQKEPKRCQSCYIFIDSKFINHTILDYSKLHIGNVNL